MVKPLLWPPKDYLWQPKGPLRAVRSHAPCSTMAHSTPTKRLERLTKTEASNRRLWAGQKGFAWESFWALPFVWLTTTLNNTHMGKNMLLVQTYPKKRSSVFCPRWCFLLPFPERRNSSRSALSATAGSSSADVCLKGSLCVLFNKPEKLFGPLEYQEFNPPAELLQRQH